jgi:hypothetical protein
LTLLGAENRCQTTVTDNKREPSETPAAKAGVAGLNPAGGTGIHAGQSAVLSKAALSVDAGGFDMPSGRAGGRQILYRRKHLATDRQLVLTQVQLPARVIIG